MRSCLVVMTVLAGGGLAGCDAGPGFGDPHVTHLGGSCTGGQEGILVLAWTVRGAAPSTASCSGIDHLQLELDGDGNSCGVTIDPIPCADDHFRYDHLPEGSGQVTLTALGAGGGVVAGGTAAVSLTPTVPSSATPIDLE